MNILFLMDPLETIKIEKDTSFILMWGASRRGHNVYYLADGGITKNNQDYTFRVVSVTPQKDPLKPFHKNKECILTQKNVDALFIRTDPPFNYNYLLNTWLLDNLAQTIPVINHPHGLRTVNEKIWAMQFTQIVPTTLITRQKDDLLAFTQKHQKVVTKPTDGYGGQAIFIIEDSDINKNVIFETLTENFKRDIILQKFIPQAAQGDKRILLVDGEPLGAVLRKHSEKDHRNNFFSGGKPLAIDITEKDKKIISVLKPHLKKLGLYFVGIDVMGDYLIEVNVTSPTCLQEMNQLYSKNLENNVISFVENLSKNYIQETE